MDVGYNRSIGIVVEPYVSGMGIDGLIVKNFFSFSVLMAMEVAFLVIHTVNKFLIPVFI